MLDDKNVALALEENAARRPRHPAIIDGDETLTYLEIAIKVRRLAGHLTDSGVGEGSIVGVCLSDSADHLMILFAVARLGAVILPLDWRWAAPEKQRVANFFQVDLAVVEPGADIGDINCAEVNDEWRAAVDHRSPDAPISQGGDQSLVLSLSSGTTGRPKGPMLSHSQFIARFVSQWVTLGFNQHDRYLSATPLYFGGGRSFTMGSLFTGGTVIMFPPPYDAEDIVAAVARYRATTLLLVPTLLRRLLQLPPEGAPLLGGLNRLLSTGAILHEDERQAVMERLNPNFINYYGSTEGGGATVLLPKHTTPATGCVGEPIYQTEIRIMDEDRRQRRSGEVGHICYRGPAVTDSFYNDPVASSYAYQNGWFYPGDLGKIDDQGLLYLVGRAKDVIIRNGVNIYPAEIEQILLTHPDVIEACAVAWPHPERGEDVAVFIVARDAVEKDELLSHCRENLASYKVPQGVFLIDEMPKSALGKIIKDSLAGQLPANK